MDGQNAALDPDAPGESIAPNLRVPLHSLMRQKWSVQLLSILDLVHSVGLCGALACKPEFADLKITNNDSKLKYIILLSISSYFQDMDSKLMWIFAPTPRR